MNTQPASLPLNNFTRRAVRAWWVDGLWDFAVAGFFAIIAGWAYILVRLMSFPSWTWPWPFQTTETIDPLHDQILLWIIGIVPLVAAYMWLTYKLVTYLKSNWLASRQGDVRHSFWFKMEKKVYAIYILIYMGVAVIAAGLCLWLTGSPRWYAVLCISAPFSILLAISGTYALPRYRWGAIIGLAASLLVELFVNSPADFQTGPLNFFQVPPQIGNPAIPLLIWTVVFLASGISGLAGVLSQPLGEGQADDQ
jgi:hypothetical protein